MRISEHTPQDRALAKHLREVRQVLTAELAGLRWQDQIGPTPAFTWNSDRAPITVRTKLTSKPLAVIVLGATTGDGSVVSTPAITWSWADGSVTISAIGTLSSSTDYTVTLGLVR